MIGVELAIALNKRGSEVTLVEMRDHLLPRIFGAEIGDRVANRLRKTGIRVFTGEKILECDQKGKNTIAVTAGLSPNISLAQDTGLNIGPLGGISVDRTMETSARDIFACGDCVESIDMVTRKPALNMFWGNAIRQGRIAGHNCMGIRRIDPGSINLTSIDIFNKRALSMGKVWYEEESDQDVERLLEDNGDFVGEYFFTHGTLNGFQLYGRIDRAGIMIQSLLRRTSLKQMKTLLTYRGKILPDPYGPGINRCFL